MKFFLVIIALGLLSCGKPDAKNINNQISGVNLDLPNHMLLKQGAHDCGVFATAAVLAIQSDEKPEIERLQKEMIGRTEKGTTYVHGILNELSKYNVKSSMRLLAWMSDGERIQYVKNALSKGRPLIVLNKRFEGFLHWYTVVGFSGDNVHIYDSLVKREGDSIFTMDLNDTASGNRTISFSEFLNEWGKADFHSIKWLVIEVG